MTTDDIAARFKRDTALHELTVLKDDGLYRHLHFARPAGEGSMFWWELVTWPGCLAVRGDMGGEWIFTRHSDMLPFFRSDGGRINPYYWAQKTELGRDSCQVYDEDVFRQVVTEHFVDAVRHGNAPRGLGKALRAEVLDQDLSNEREAGALLEEFEFGAVFEASCLCGESAEFADGAGAHLWRHRHIRADNAMRAHVSSVERKEGFRFSDVWEWSFRDFDPSFVWACHAIVRGIQMYDLHRAIPAVEAPAANFTPAWRHKGVLYDLTRDFRDSPGDHWRWLGTWDKDGSPLLVCLTDPHVQDQADPAAAIDSMASLIKLSGEPLQHIRPAVAARGGAR